MTTDSTSAENASSAAGAAPEQAQVHAALTSVEGETALGVGATVELAGKLPLQLDLRVPVPSFRVQNLLSLEKGKIVETAWPHTEDLPLWCGDVQLVWSEFEVVDQKLAVRVTRLA
jgi:flagellar motor switch protein FliN/FliY